VFGGDFCSLFDHRRAAVCSQWSVENASVILGTLWMRRQQQQQLLQQQCTYMTAATDGAK